MSRGGRGGYDKGKDSILDETALRFECVANLDSEKLWFSTGSPPCDLQRLKTRQYGIDAWLLQIHIEDGEREIQKLDLPAVGRLIRLEGERLAWKYWFLDTDSNYPPEDVPSTNGAVDSQGTCHSRKACDRDKGGSEVDIRDYYSEAGSPAGSESSEEIFFDIEKSEIIASSRSIGPHEAVLRFVFLTIFKNR